MAREADKEFFATYNAILWGLTILVSICMLGTSFSILMPWQYGLEFDNNVMFLHSEVFGGGRKDSGRFHTGLGVDFIKFPKTVVELEFSYHKDANAGNITCRTLEGLPVNLGVAMQYTLMPEMLAEMYLRYGDVENHKKFLIKYSRAAVMDVCVKRKVVDWFPNRTALGIDFFNQVADTLKYEGVEMRSLQLLYIGIPFEVQKQIEDTARAAQSIEKAEYNVSAERVRADTRILKAQQENLRVGIAAAAFANETVVAANAAAEALNLSVSSEIAIYKNVTQTLNLTKEELLAYMWLHAVRGNDESSQIIEISRPSSVGIE